MNICPTKSQLRTIEKAQLSNNFPSHTKHCDIHTDIGVGGGGSGGAAAPPNIRAHGNFRARGAFFWALMRCPKVAILPKSYDTVLWLQALLCNQNKNVWTRGFFWAPQKCPKVTILPKSNDIILWLQPPSAIWTENVWIRRFFGHPRNAQKLLFCPKITI